MSSEPQTTDNWTELLQGIQARITPQQFETWFRGVQPGTCTEDVLVITVANAFSREWLRKKFADVILSAAEKASGGRRPTLKIRVRESGEGEGDAGSVISKLVLPTAPASKARERNGATAGPASRPATVGDQPVATPISHLNPHFRFDSFITGPANRLPWAAARTVVEGGSRSYNPLFIHGAVGLGKTHLLQAVACALGEQRGSRVIYVPCEQFINHFIAAVERRSLDAFRRRYREADALIVDDVHLLANKERSQEEFLHTFNCLYNAGRQIVLSGDMDPGAMNGLTERLSSRFRWGLVCEVGSPEFQTREGIVRAKAERLGGILPEEVVRFIAESVRASVRELEGAVTRVVGHAALSEVPPSLDLAQTVLKDVVISNRRHVTIENIAGVITERYGVRLSELQGKRRTQAIVVPRQLCMYLARRLTGKSLETIGGYFGGRDHSTVLYAVDRIDTKIKRDDRFRSYVEDITGEVLRKVD